MSVFDRISALLKSNINDLIQRAEDPEKMIDQAIADLTAQLVEAKSRVALAIADEKRLEKDLQRQQESVQDWENKAMAAVRAGRDDLAVQALERKKTPEGVVAQLTEQLAEQGQAVSALKQGLRAISLKVEEARRERNRLLARQQRAQAQASVAETLVKMNDPKAMASLSKLSDRVDRMEAQAQARLEVASISSGILDDPVAEELRQLEATHGSVEANDDLLALKRKMGLLSSGQAVAELSEGASPSEDSDP